MVGANHWPWKRGRGGDDGGGAGRADAATPDLAELQDDRTRGERIADTIADEKAEQLTEGPLSEVLRNSQATLAIAKHLGIKLDGIEEREREPAKKVDEVQQQLAEVEDVLEEQPGIGASRSLTHSPGPGRRTRWRHGRDAPDWARDDRVRGGSS